MFEVKNAYGSSWRDTIAAAEEEYFAQCNRFEFVELVKHETGKQPEIVRSTV